MHSEEKAYFAALCPFSTRTMTTLAFCCRAPLSNFTYEVNVYRARTHHEASIKLSDKKKYCLSNFTTVAQYKRI